MAKAILPAKLLLRNVYRLLKQRDSWQDVLTIDEATVGDLEWWIKALDTWNGKAFRSESKSCIQITTDASEIAWGGTMIGCPHIMAQGYWDDHMSNQHPHLREIMAVLMTLESFLPYIKGKAVQVLTDNITTAAYINFQGGASKLLDGVARNIWLLSITNAIQIQARYLPGVMNQEADRLSRLSNLYEWKLHPQLFKYLDQLYGPHTIDRFASMSTRQCKRYNSLHLDPWTEGVDALHQNNWASENNFVNPPFRLLSKILNHIRATESNATIIAPMWPAQPWYPELVNMAVHPPLKLPKTKHICLPIQSITPEPMKNARWRMYAWRVSGKNIY